MAKSEHEMSVPERITMVIHNGFLARYAEAKLGLSIVTPEEPDPDDPEAPQPSPCVQCGERAIELGADCLTLELAAQHMLPKHHPYEPTEEDAEKSIHFRCWDAFRSTLSGRELITVYDEALGAVGDRYDGLEDAVRILAHLMKQHPALAAATLEDPPAELQDVGTMTLGDHVAEIEGVIEELGARISGLEMFPPSAEEEA
jgi:hypothetical protein